MEVVEVRVDGTFLSLNEVIRKTKGNWKSYHRLSKQQQNRILVACLQQKPGKVTEPVLVEFHWTTASLRVDPDNTAFSVKFVLDGLQDAGVLPKDTRKWIKAIHHEFPDPDPDHPHVIVRLVPWQSVDVD